MSFKVEITVGTELTKHGDKLSKKDAQRGLSLLVDGITTLVGGCTVTHGKGAYTHDDGHVAHEQSVTVTTIADVEHHHTIRELIRDTRDAMAQESVLLVITEINDYQFI